MSGAKEWMKDHAAKIVAGVIIVAVLLIVVVPYLRDDKPTALVCAGASCPLKSAPAPQGDQATPPASGMKSGPKPISIAERIKQVVAQKK